MKIIIYILVPVIILTFLYNKNILPSMIYYILMVIVSLIGAVFLIKRYVSIISRDNMNYDTYNWPFDASTAPTGSGNSEDPWGTSNNLGTCVGEYCCSEGQIYDVSLNVCVIGTKETTTTTETTSTEPTTEGFLTEAMVNNILTKTQQNKYKTDYSLKNNYEAYNKK